jgi:hypothetical protein
MGGQANVGKGIISIMESFGLQLQAETINLQEYTLQMQKLQDQINSIADEGARANVINQAVDSLISDENLRTQIKSVQDLDKRFLLLQASGGASGLVMDDLIKKANDSASSNEDLAKAINEVTAAQIENNKIANQQIDLEIITEEAVGGLREETAAINDKITAYNLLVAAGYSAADSLSLLNNQVLVGQIVQANSVASTVTDINNLLAAQAAMNAITARASTGGGGQKSAFQEAIDSLKEQAKEAKNSIMAYAKLRTAGLSVAESSKIAGDSMLAAALASQQVGSRKWNELVTAIRAARAEEEAWLSSTPEGRAEQFAEVYGKVMDVFDAQEAILEMNNEAATATNRKLIESLEKQIDAYNRRINILQRDLDSISEKEDEINKAYDERTKALETVKKLNQDIINQQKSQISIADALSRGDISAAASAIQDSRAQNAAAQGDALGAALDASRQGQLNALTQNGKTRAQIEAEIKKLKKDISDIEFGALQTARDIVQAADDALESARENLEVQGQSRTEWENIQKGIDLSKAKASLYEAEVLKALENARGLVGEWDKLNDTFTTTHVINTVRTGGGGGGGGGGVVDETASDGQNPAYTDLVSKIQGMEAQYAAYQSQLTPLNEEKAKYQTQRDQWWNMSIWPKLDAQIKDVQNKINGILDAQRWTGRGISDYRAKLAATPQYLADGGFAKGTDTVPAMLTPGEFVVNSAATKRFAPILEAINTGSFKYSIPSGPTIPNDFAQPVYNMPSRKYADVSDSAGIYSTSSNPTSLTAQDNSVYNYSLSVNVEGTNVSANDIANVVMNKIKTIDSQQVRRQVLR